MSALASLDGNKLAVLLWHYHDDDVAGPEAAIQLALSGVPVPASAVTVRQYRIDAEHSNSFEVWKRMGSPEKPTPEQVAELEQAGQLGSVVGPALSAGEAGSIHARLNLPRQGVSLLVLEWKKQPAK